jgi:hypothetical protein
MPSIRENSAISPSYDELSAIFSIRRLCVNFTITMRQ